MNSPATAHSNTSASPGSPTILIVCLSIGAILGMGLVQTVDPIIRMPADLGSPPLIPTPEYSARYDRAYTNMWTGNMAIDFALIGLGVGVVIAAAYVRGAAAISRMMLALASVLGGLAGGAITGRLIASAHITQGKLNLFGFSLDFMLQSVLFQTICWGAIGVGIGVALALRQKRPISNGVAGGILGGFAAGLVHALLGSIVFPNSDMSNLLPPNLLERILWAGYSGACVGTAIWFAGRDSSNAPKTQQA